MSNYKKGGYDRKYIIQKTNGKPVDPEAEYFVFRLDKDPYALDALYMYACSLTYVNPELSNQLIKIIDFYKWKQNKKGIKKEDHMESVRRFNKREGAGNDG